MKTKQPEVIALIKARKQLGITRSEFAKRCGLSAHTIKSLETGRMEMRHITALRVSVRLRMNIAAGTTESATTPEILAIDIADFIMRLYRRAHE